MISKTMHAILHALSYGNIEVEASRRLVDIKKLDAIRIFLKKLDEKVYNGDYEIPIRLYFPSEEAMKKGIEEQQEYPVLLFFHPNGFSSAWHDGLDYTTGSLQSLLLFSHDKP